MSLSLEDTPLELGTTGIDVKEWPLLIHEMIGSLLAGSVIVHADLSGHTVFEDQEGVLRVLVPSVVNESGLKLLITMLESQHYEVFHMSPVASREDKDENNVEFWDVYVQPTDKRTTTASNGPWLNIDGCERTKQWVVNQSYCDWSCEKMVSPTSTISSTSTISQVSPLSPDDVTDLFPTYADDRNEI
jgi:hypothetical protein